MTASSQEELLHRRQDNRETARRTAAVRARSYPSIDPYHEIAYTDPKIAARLIIGSALAVAGLGILWLRGRKDDVGGDRHGANQE